MLNLFAAGEKLYRAVQPKDMYFKEDGSLSSAAFKSSNGCSVDRGDGRTDIEAADFMMKKLTGDIYRIDVGDCIEKDVFIRHEPVEDDPYHSGLYRDKGLSDMTQGQCKYLSKVAVKVKENSSAHIV